MTLEQAREWLQRHADNTPMPGAREAYKTILEEMERNRWIPVEERLPEKRRMVLLHFESGYELVGCLINSYREQNCWVAKKINSPGLEIVVDPDYWMLLPEPPGVE
nr:MAG TPA: Protein of unknown function (DUF551) [Bacteriophage sp.]